MPLVTKVFAGSLSLKLKLLPIVVALAVLMPMPVKPVIPPATDAPVVVNVKLGSIETAPATPVWVKLSKFKGKLIDMPARPAALPAVNAEPAFAAAITAAGDGAVPNLSVPVGAAPIAALET